MRRSLACFESPVEPSFFFFGLDDAIFLVGFYVSMDGLGGCSKRWMVEVMDEEKYLAATAALTTAGKAGIVSARFLATSLLRW